MGTPFAESLPCPITPYPPSPRIVGRVCHPDGAAWSSRKCCPGCFTWRRCCPKMLQGALTCLRGRRIKQLYAWGGLQGSISHLGTLAAPPLPRAHPQEGDTSVPTAPKAPGDRVRPPSRQGGSHRSSFPRAQAQLRTQGGCQSPGAKKNLINIVLRRIPCCRCAGC